MSRSLIPLGLCVVFASAAVGQTLPGQPMRPQLPGAPQPGELPASLTESRVQFNPLSIDVRNDGSRFQLWAGRTLIKDFGDNREHAYEARRLIADLQLTERGTIGTPEPVMEFWLAGGEAPPPPTHARNVIPFDAKTLTAEKLNGNYVLRDSRQVLFNFGPYVSDAKQALAVCQKYQFNEVGLIGTPRPSMTYMIHNRNPRAVFAPPDQIFNPKQMPQQAPRHALVLPKLGTVGERTSFDPLRAEMKKAADGWHLVAGPHDLARIGNSDYAAREAVLVVQRYPLNEYVRVGTSGYGFFLSRGAARRGAPIGVRQSSFDPRTLAIKQTDDRLDLTDGRRVLTSFRANQADDANLALSVVRYYGFDTQCEVGGLKFLAKER